MSALQSKVDENTTSISQINTELDNKNDEIAQINSTLEEHTESINANITTDRIEDGAVTIGKLEPSIQSLITNISKNASFAGIATPTTNPGKPDGPVFYLATQAGVYVNFNGIELTEGEVVILQWNNGTWSKQLTGISSLDNIYDLSLKVDGNKKIFSGTEGSNAAFYFDYVISSNNEYEITNMSDGTLVVRIQNGSTTVGSYTIKLAETIIVSGLDATRIGGWVGNDASIFRISVNKYGNLASLIELNRNRIAEEEIRARLAESEIKGSVDDVNEELSEHYQITEKSDDDLGNGSVGLNGKISVGGGYKYNHYPIILKPHAIISLSVIAPPNVQVISSCPFSTKVDSTTITGDVSLTNLISGYDYSGETKEYTFQNKTDKDLFVVLCAKNWDGSYSLKENALVKIGKIIDESKRVITIEPNSGINMGMTNVYSNNEKFFGTLLYNSILNNVNGIKNYVTWAKEVGASTLFLLFPENLVSNPEGEDSKIFNELVYEANNKGIDVCGTTYRLPKFSSAQDGTDTIGLQSWYDFLVTMASYNGQNEKHDTKGNVIYPKVKYFRCGDELAVEYKNYRYTPEDCLKIQSLTNSIIKAENPNAVVLSITANQYVDEYHSIFLTSKISYNIEYSSGKFVAVSNESYADSHDIELVDFYNLPERLVNNDDTLHEVWLRGLYLMYEKYNELSPELLDKPMWFCSGQSSYDVKDEEVARRYVRTAILSSWFGAERFIMFRQFHCGGSFKPNSQDQYYGLMHPSVTNSFVSFLRGNGTDAAITDGDASRRVYIGFPIFQEVKYPGYVFIKLSYSYTAKNLESTGLKITGRKFTITRVELCSGCEQNADVVKTLYSGTPKRIETYADSLIIDKSQFSGIMEAGQYIKVYYSDADKSMNAVKDTLPAYNKVQKFSKVFNGERPQINIIGNDIYIASWKDKNRIPWYAIWALSARTVSVSVDGIMPLFYNSNFENLGDFNKDEVMLNTDLLFISKAQSITVTIKK